MFPAAKNSPILGARTPGKYFTLHPVCRPVSGHDPPVSFRFNKLRTTGGSYRLTLVKSAVDAAEVDPRPPRPELAHLPAARGAWLGIDIERHPDQRGRVAAREAVTVEFAPGASMVGEYPVPLRGKLGSAVTRIPGEIIDRLDLETGDQLTTIAIADGALLFVTQGLVESAPADVAAAIAGARVALA
jgi:hypothetical protein